MTEEEQSVASDTGVYGQPWGGGRRGFRNPVIFDPITHTKNPPKLTKNNHETNRLERWFSG